MTDKREPEIIDAEFTDVTDKPASAPFPEPVSTQGQELVPVTESRDLAVAEPPPQPQPDTEQPAAKALEVIEPEPEPEKKKPTYDDDYKATIVDVIDDKDDEVEYWEDDDDVVDYNDQFYGGHPDALVQCIHCGRSMRSSNAHTVQGYGPLGPECVHQFQQQAQQQALVYDDQDYAVPPPEETYYPEPVYSEPDYEIASYSSGGHPPPEQPVAGDWGNRSSQASERYAAVANTARESNQAVAESCGCGGGGAPAGGGCMVFNGPVYIENMTVNCGGKD